MGFKAGGEISILVSSGLFVFSFSFCFPLFFFLLISKKIIYVGTWLDRKELGTKGRWRVWEVAASPFPGFLLQEQNKY